MDLRCPNCDHGISRWQLLGFLRLLSISCPQCRTLLAIDSRGRAVLIGSILASIPFAAILMQFTDAKVAVPAAVVAGFVFGCVASAKVGRLGVSPEDSGRQRKG